MCQIKNTLFRNDTPIDATNDLSPNNVVVVEKDQEIKKPFQQGAQKSIYQQQNGKHKITNLDHVSNFFK